MTRIAFIRLAAILFVALVGWTELPAAPPITYTTIHVQDMHCGECAKKSPASSTQSPA